MIGFLDGKVVGRGPDGCFIDVSGVGYRVTCSATTMAALPLDGRRARVWTYVHAREDALSLFGFATEGEQHLFEALLSVSGVGPRVALQVCSAFSPDAFRRVLATDDTGAIASVPGIGKKTAQRIVIDLKEKLSVPGLEGAQEGPDALAKARSALENLGYSSGEIRLALSHVATDGGVDLEDLVKRALKVLA